MQSSSHFTLKLRAKRALRSESAGMAGVTSPEASAVVLMPTGGGRKFGGTNGSGARSLLELDQACADPKGCRCARPIRPARKRAKARKYACPLGAGQHLTPLAAPCAGGTSRAAKAGCNWLQKCDPLAMPVRQQQVTPPEDDRRLA